jgi:CARDB
MRPIAIALTSLALLTAAQTSAVASPVLPPQAAVIVSACHPADDVSARFATFVGEMRSLTGTARMSMRFTLLEKLGTRDFLPVPLSDLRPLRKSKRGVSTFIYTQRVTALRDGGTYRMRVQFRWYDATGKATKTRTVHSGACHQPAPLPNLVIDSVTRSAGTMPGTSNYSVTVRNAGAGDAGAFAIALRVDGGLADAAHMPSLPAGQSATVQMNGPPCGAVARAVVDPANAVKETNESDNLYTLACTG